MYRTFKFKLDNEKFKLTDEGYLICEGSCARTGIQNYPKEDGGIVREFRSPDEVFSKESLDTHKAIPITMYHPDCAVDASTFKDIVVGITGTNPRKDNRFVVNNFKIMDKATVDEILAKKDRGESTEISMGYHCQLEEKQGLFNDEKYDAIQKEIRCNHAALCDEGTARAGSGARLRLDSDKNSTELALFLLDQRGKRPIQTIIISKEIAKTASAARKIAKEFGEIKKTEETGESFRFRQMEPGLFKEKSFRTFQVPGKPGVSLVFGTLKERKDTMPILKKDAIKAGGFTMDAINEEFEDGSEGLVNRLSAKLDEAVSEIEKLIENAKTVKADGEKTDKEKNDELDKIRAQADQLKEDKDKLEKEIAELSDMNSERVQDMIKETARIKAVADHFEVDTKDKTDKEIKIAVIKSESPECKVDEETDGYIDGRFDLIAEKVDAAKKDDKDAKDSLRDFTRNSKKTTEPKNNVRETFMKNTRDAYKTGTSFPATQ
jgi:hypothetical protein